MRRAAARTPPDASRRRWTCGRAREREQAARRFRPEKVNLSDEEKARRLAEFASDGAAHDGRRAERLRHHRGNEAKDSIAEDLSLIHI